jgi:hypothetical protein
MWYNVERFGGKKKGENYGIEEPSEEEVRLSKVPSHSHGA